MIDFKSLIKKSITASALPSLISSTRSVPKPYQITDKILLEFSTIFSRTKIDPVVPHSLVSLEQIKQLNSRLSLWFDAITYASNKMDDEFKVNSDKYARICRRIINNNIDNKNRMSEILNYSCRYIDTVYDKERNNTSVANIGSYITLPFSLGNTKIYSGRANLTIFSTDDITFSNEASISSIPLQRPVSIKYTPSSKNTSIVVSLGINQVTSNLIYINTSGPVESITMNCSLNGAIVVSKTVYDKECLFNFPKADMDSVSFTILASQLNLAKQNAINVNELTIFDSIFFMSSGVFESVAIKLDDYINTSKILVNAKDFNITTRTKVDKYMSVALTDQIKSFIKVSDSYSTMEVPISKIVNVKNLNDLEQYPPTYELIKDPNNPRNEISVKFFKYNIGAAYGNEDMLDINYKNMAMLAGTNDAYGKGGEITWNNNVYENWTKVDNYWKTMLLNYETGVTLDLGKNKIKINGREYTGSITMPTGFSLIEVHETLFDKTFGGKSTSSTFNGIENNSNVLSDPLFPNNFAYKLAGLPVYQENGGVSAVETMQDAQISGVTVIQLDDPFLPLSVEITGQLTGGSTYTYEQYFGYSPIQPGTYTVEPSKGLIRVFGKEIGETQGVDISYIKAQRNFRPCGVLFNRLQRYINYRVVHNLLSQTGRMDDTFISMIATSGEKTIMIPEINNARIYHNKLLYSNGSQSAYGAIKLLLKTNSNELTPVIKNIFLEGRK